MTTHASASTILDSRAENLGTVTLSWVGVEVGGEGVLRVEVPRQSIQNLLFKLCCYEPFQQEGSIYKPKTDLFWYWCPQWEHLKFQEKEYVKSFSTWGSSFNSAGSANTGLSISPAKETREKERLEAGTGKWKRKPNHQSTPESIQRLCVNTAGQSVGHGGTGGRLSTSPNTTSELSSHASLFIFKCHENIGWTYGIHSAFLLKGESLQNYNPVH